MGRRYGNRWARCVLALAVIGSAVGCEPTPPTPPFRSTQGSWTVGTVTSDGSDRYEFVDQGRGMQVTAPSSNRASNLRVTGVKQRTSTSVNHGSCVTWHGPVNSITQPGIVLRARLDAERTRAIMITDNIWMGFRSVINVHLADSDLSPAYSQLGYLDMEAGLGSVQDLKPLPWRFCAQAIGSTLTVKAWSIPAHPVEPPWTDPAHAATIQLPESAVYPGQPGVFIGHLRAGETTVLSGHTTWLTRQRPDPPPIRAQGAVDSDE